MGALIYAANTSLDGFLEDDTGSFDWSAPAEDVHAFWNERERRIGTSLYGRRIYEAMRVWETDDWLTDEPPVVREYAGIWRDTDKVVYSTSLAEVSTARTRIERTFDPEAVRRLKEASDADLSIGGAAVAASETEATTASGCSSSAADSTPHPTLVGDEPLMLVEHFLHHVVSEASHDDDPAGSQPGHRTDELKLHQPHSCCNRSRASSRARARLLKAMYSGDGSGL